MLSWAFEGKTDMREVTEGPTKLTHQKMKSLLKRRDAHSTYTNRTQEGAAAVRCIQREKAETVEKEAEDKKLKKAAKLELAR